MQYNTPDMPQAHTHLQIICTVTDKACLALLDGISQQRVLQANTGNGDIWHPLTIR